MSRRGAQQQARESTTAGAGGEGGRAWPWVSLARGLALAAGGFTLLSALGALLNPAWDAVDAAAWWLVVPLPGRAAGPAVLAAGGVALVAAGVAPRLAGWRRWATLALVSALAAAAAWDGVAFYLGWREGQYRPAVPLPLSFVAAALLVWLVWVLWRPPAAGGRAAATLLTAATVVALAVLFPLAQVLFFGTTDYRCRAPFVVVFGAEVHRDGRMSTSLRDRVETALGLYRDGLVRQVIVSGGVGESGYNEALVMREALLVAGVPAADVVVDSDGVNTLATVRHTAAFFTPGSRPAALAVSQFYHLPRIRLAYQQLGWDVRTVPARRSQPIRQTPWLVLREVPAFWLYYLRAVWG